MNRHIKSILAITLILTQFLIARYTTSIRFHVDCIYLVIFFLAVKGGYLQSMISAALLGLLTDILSGGILGDFSFARTLAVFLVGEASRFLDLRKSSFIFILIGLSLFLSNLVANAFINLARDFRYDLPLIFIQPMITAAIGTLLTATRPIKRQLDVY